MPKQIINLTIIETEVNGEGTINGSPMNDTCHYMVTDNDIGFSWEGEHLKGLVCAVVQMVNQHNPESSGRHALGLMHGMNLASEFNDKSGYLIDGCPVD